MIDKALKADFFNRAADTVAFDLIGCRLYWNYAGRSDSRIITETEAYTGPDDLASHAAKGRTKRTEVMFGEPGRLYIYLVYGLHWMLNVVTGPVGYPAAVLIRGLQGINGPARLTKVMGVTDSLNGKPAEKKSGVWFIEGPRPPGSKIIRSGRIGVEYAGPVWAAKPYRFTLSV
jgi:DNA-3-methyladenine glycosylase